MLKVGDYVMINKKACKLNSEINNLFGRVARIIGVIEYDYKIYYELDITKHCSRPYIFSESLLINIKYTGGI